MDVTTHLIRSVSMENRRRVFVTVCGQTIRAKLSAIPFEVGVTGWASQTTCEECLPNAHSLFTT